VYDEINSSQTFSKSFHFPDVGVDNAEKRMITKPFDTHVGKHEGVDDDHFITQFEQFSGEYGPDISSATSD
jgi:hypothetical protein